MRGCPVACAELSEMYSAEDLMSMMDHGMHSQACAYTPVVQTPDPTPLFFKRKSKLPSRADLDLKLRILKLRNKLIAEKAKGVKK